MAADGPPRAEGAISGHTPTWVAADDRQLARRTARRGGGSGAQGRGTEAPTRSASREDRDRLLYSSAFARLVDVTQVVTPDARGFLTHNRLTHSLKVAQVARDIAEHLLERSEREPDLRDRLAALGGLDADVVEAAALAHDIGHAPFGHVGERALDAVARSECGLDEGFEGNAQSFRVITRLERRGSAGLDLTAATRAAVAKYPWTRGEPLDPDEADRHDDATRLRRIRSEKFSAYATELAELEQARAFLDGYPAQAQSLEAAIMDVADDIAYALHDLADFYQAGILPARDVTDALASWLDARRSAATLDPAPTGSVDLNPFPADPGDDAWPADPAAEVEGFGRKLERYYPQFDEAVFEQAVRSLAAHLEAAGVRAARPGSGASLRSTRSLVTAMLDGYRGLVSVAEDPGRLAFYAPPVSLDPLYWHQIQLLKQITRAFVIRSPRLAAIQRGQQRLLTQLLDMLLEWRRSDRSRVPTLLREELDRHDGDGGTQPERAVIDYVASLSDHQAVELHRQLSGSTDSVVGSFVS